MFVFDSSSSIGHLNWFRMKQFAIDVIQGTVGPIVFSNTSCGRQERIIYFADNIIVFLSHYQI